VAIEIYHKVGGLITLMQKMSDIYYLKQIDDFMLLQIDLKNDLRNYNYILHYALSGETIAVDPTDSTTTIKALNHFGWSLQQIWITHHHYDHVGGNVELAKHYDCSVIGNSYDAARIPAISHFVKPNDAFNFAGVTVEVLNMDGHTVGHIAYHIKELELLFAGDTIFSLGCGRVFEGTHAQMWQSLNRIKALPPQTLLCISHEYTLDNAHFAAHVMSKNAAIMECLQAIKQKRALKQPTVPNELQYELKHNPFLIFDNAEDFKHLRLLKDSFKKS
jgi:hydroxyacylglutathione hydrolase